MNKKQWYGAKCIFQHFDLTEDEEVTVYEERVVMVRASSFDEAIKLGEAEAEEYAASLSGVHYVGFIDAYQLSDLRLTEGTEVYSLMRESKLSVKDFLDHYHDDGTECRQKPIS